MGYFEITIAVVVALYILSLILMTVLMTNEVEETAYLSFQVPRKKIKELYALKEELGLKNGMDLFNNALTLMKWAIKESKKGRKIGSYDAKSDTFGQVTLPVLEALRKKAHSKQNDTP